MKKSIIQKSIFVSILFFLVLSCTSKTDELSLANRLDPQDLQASKDNLNNLNLDQKAQEGKDLETGKRSVSKKTRTVACDFSWDEDVFPFYIEDQSVVVMNAKSVCKQRKNSLSIDRFLYYTLMGFPCSGENGNMRIYGGAYSPKMVSYSLDTGCKMKQPDLTEVVSVLKQKLDLDRSGVEFRLASYNPIEVHFWTIEGWQDSGLDPSINFRSLKIKSELWPSMRDRGAWVTVNIYGRENSWQESSNLIGAKLLIKNEADSKFSIRLENVQILDKYQIKEVQDKCIQTRKNKKECQDI